MNAMTDYANIEERDAAIAAIKARCRDDIATISQYATERGHYLAVMPTWIDGVWGDYWYVDLDGQPIGEIFYDGFGPVVKGDKLSALYARAARAAERAAA